MAIEPLSETTRTTKRNLLISSVLAITYRGFDVTIDKLPFAGIVVDFNKGIFAFLLTALLGYFLITFCVFYLIDLQNAEEPPYQAKGSENYHRELQGRIQRFTHIIKNRADRALDKSGARILFTSQMGELLYRLARSSRADNRELIAEHNARSLYELQQTKDVNARLDASAYEIADSSVLDSLRGFMDFERSSSLIAKSRLAGLNSFYGLRNYVLEGALPIALGIAAILAMYQILPLQWLRYIAPAQ